MRASYRVAFRAKRMDVMEEPVSRLARQLALAYQIEQWLDEGVVKNMAEVARRLGLTDARVTQVCDLALLSPRLQTDIITGRLVIDPKGAQRATRHALWRDQEREVAALVAEGATRKTRRRWELVGVRTPTLQPPAGETGGG